MVDKWVQTAIKLHDLLSQKDLDELAETHSQAYCAAFSEGQFCCIDDILSRGRTINDQINYCNELNAARHNKN